MHLEYNSPLLIRLSLLQWNSSLIRLSLLQWNSGLIRLSLLQWNSGLIRLSLLQYNSGLIRLSLLQWNSGLIRLSLLQWNSGLIRLSLLQWNSGLIRGVVSIEGDILELFDYLSASEIWPDKRGSFWWSDLTRGELFSKRKCNIQNETTDQNNISVITYTSYSPVGMSCSATGVIMSDSLGRCLTNWCLDTVQCVYKSFTELETDTYWKQSYGLQNV